VELVNTTAVKQYDGLKYSGDHQDAFHLAHLMRLGILPTGYIYPPELRQVRDLLRRRRQLVRHASTHVMSIQNQIWRSLGYREACNAIRRKGFLLAFEQNGFLFFSANNNLILLHTLDLQIKVIEKQVLEALSGFIGLTTGLTPPNMWGIFLSGFLLLPLAILTSMACTWLIKKAMGQYSRLVIGRDFYILKPLNNSL
jgi:transposase